MDRMRKLGAVFVTSLVALVGCGSGASPQDLAIAADLGSAPDLQPLPTVSAAGTVTSSAQAVNLPLADVTVCLFPQKTQCTTTNATGFFELDGLPGGLDLVLSFDKTGYLPDLVPIAADSNASPQLALIPSATWTAWVSAAGSTWDPAKGAAIFTLVSTTTLANGKATMAPASGDGPFYIDPSTMPPTPQASSIGPSLFLNVAPATYTFTATATGKNCTLLVGWGADGSKSVKGPLAPGYATTVVSRCM